MTTVASALSSLLQQSNNINIDNFDITIPIIPPRTIKIKTILLAEHNNNNNNNNKTPLADPSGAELDTLYQKSSRSLDIDSNITTTAEDDNTSRESSTVE